jgi:hypothetical protein
MPSTNDDRDPIGSAPGGPYPWPGHEGGGDWLPTPGILEAPSWWGNLPISKAPWRFPLFPHWEPGAGGLDPVSAGRMPGAPASVVPNTAGNFMNFINFAGNLRDAAPDHPHPWTATARAFNDTAHVCSPTRSQTLRGN